MECCARRHGHSVTQTLGSVVLADEEAADLGEAVADLGRRDHLDIVGPPGEVLGDDPRRSGADLYVDPLVVTVGRRIGDDAGRRAELLAEADRTRAGRRAPRPARGKRLRSTASTISCQVAARSKFGGRTALAPVSSSDLMRFTRNVRRPLSVSPTRYHVDPFSTRPSGWTSRVVSVRGPVGVAETHLHARDDGSPQVVEEMRSRHRLRAPARRVEDGRAGRQLGVSPERLGERLDEFAERRLGLRRRGRGRSGDHEQRRRLGLGEPAEVGAGAADELPTAVAPGLRVHRNAGDRRALRGRDAAVFTEISNSAASCGRRDAPTGLQNEQRGHQSIGAHVTSVAPNLDIT